jgi:predicted CoA-substrate-specific enzyme activase
VTYTAGLDVGSTYTKAVILDDEHRIVGRAMVKTGFKLEQAAQRAFKQAQEQAQLDANHISYVVSTGYGRYQVSFRDINVTDLTAAARGSRFFFPETRTVLDIGGQTMKALRLDDSARVTSFRLNDKCAAGTGAFLEKTARYMGFTTEEIGPLVLTSKDAVPISGVCAVFAESEVINHLSHGSAPADIMHGAMASLVDRSVQLMKRVRMEQPVTVAGGILRFRMMAEVVRRKLEVEVNVPPDDLVQFLGAIGAGALGQLRVQRLAETAADGESLRPDIQLSR